MTDEETTSADELLEQFVQLSQELTSDRERLRKLNRDQTLSNPASLASEVAQTVFPALVDTVQVLAHLLPEYQDGIVQLEEATYTQIPKAFELLGKALVAKGTLDQAQYAKIIETLGPSAEVESYLSKVDGELIVESLLAYKQLLESTSPEQSTTQVEAAIDRVRQSTDGLDSDNATPDTIAPPDTAPQVLETAAEVDTKEVPAQS